uniref:Putative WD40/YVTN repeat-like-containing domain-containing protein n=1 Tax=Helianthus annuus TaxID=4232 RepID=A0A251S7X3_HELAN
MLYKICRQVKNAHILAVTVRTARKCEWLAHDNAVFDLCWIKDDTNLLTACVIIALKYGILKNENVFFALTGHTGSVKSISAHPSNHDIIVSGSRDGSFALWDLRSFKSTRAHPNTL